MEKNYSKFHAALFGDSLEAFEEVVSRRRSYSDEDFELIFKKKYPLKSKKARLLFENHKPTTEQIKYMIYNDYAFFFEMLAQNQELTLEEEACLFNHGSERMKTAFSLKARWGKSYEERFVKSTPHKVLERYYKIHKEFLPERIKNLCTNRLG